MQITDLTPQELRWMIERRASGIFKAVQRGVPAKKLVDQARVLMVRLQQLADIEELYEKEKEELKTLGKKEYEIMKGYSSPDQRFAVTESAKQLEDIQEKINEKKREIAALKSLEREEEPEAVRNKVVEKMEKMKRKILGNKEEDTEDEEYNDESEDEFIIEG